MSNPHDDLYPAESRYLVKDGEEDLEVRSEYQDGNHARWGEIKITEEGVSLDIGIIAPVKEIE